MIIITKIILIILYILFFLVGIILLACIVPLSYSAFLKIYNSNLNGTISVNLLKGLIGAKIVFEEKSYFNLILLGRTVFTDNIENKTKEPNKIKKSKQPKNKQRKKIHKDEIEFKKIGRILKEFILKLWKQLKPNQFKLSGIYGFENPATTGIVYGMISILNNFRVFKINFHPTFIEELIDAEVEIDGQIRLINLIILFIFTIIKRPIRKLIFRKKEKINLQSEFI